MMIDQEKIIKKSKSLTGGFKGVIPRVQTNKKLTRFDYMRIFIGVMLTGLMIAGTIILFLNLLSVGSDMIENKAQPKKAPDFKDVQIIFTPKQND